MKPFIARLLLITLTVTSVSPSVRADDDTPPLPETSAVSPAADQVDQEQILAQLEQLGLVNDKNRDAAKSVIASKLDEYTKAAADGKSVNIPEMISSSLKDIGVADVSNEDIKELQKLKVNVMGDSQGPIVGHEDIMKLKVYSLRFKKVKIYKQLAQLHSEIYLINKEASSRGYQFIFSWLDNQGKDRMAYILGGGAASLWIGSAIVRNATTLKTGFLNVTLNQFSHWTGRVGYLTLASLIVGYVLSGGELADNAYFAAHELNTASPEKLQAMIETRVRYLEGWRRILAETDDEIARAK